jgi:hypothetical protein
MFKQVLVIVPLAGWIAISSPAQTRTPAQTPPSQPASAPPAAAGAGGPSDHDWESLLPEAEGKDYVVALCGRCHNLKAIALAHRGRGEWRGVIVTMNSHGANLAPEDTGIIATYLVEHFGPNRPAVEFPLDINVATAEQLGLFPDLSSEDVAKIVAARKVKRFSALEELAPLIDNDKLAKIKPFLVVR